MHVVEEEETAGKIVVMRYLNVALRMIPLIAVQ
jgi:hypothetical protein